MTTLLEVENLTTRFYTQDGIVHAVNGISYTLEKGESMALVGESGCGKSVSALSLIGLVPSPPGKVVDGRVLFAGDDLVQKTDRELQRIRGQEIAMIFQDPMTSLNPVLPIGKQVMESLRLHMNMSKAEAKARSAELLTLVGIPDANGRLEDYPHQFSGGQRQRINIAMALSCNPALLIADEPTTALDVTIQAQIVDLVQDLKRKLGMSVIWITHDLGVVASLVDKVAVMYAGHLVEQAKVFDLYEQTSHPYTLGLLESLPKLNMKNKQRLIPIDGSPPDLLEEVEHCPFAPRCRFAIDRCWQERPLLHPVAPDHYSACWCWQGVMDEAKNRAVLGEVT